MSTGEVISVRSSGVATSVAMLVVQALHGFVVGTPIYWNGTIWVKAISDSNSQANGTLCTNIVKEVKNANSFAIVIGKDDIIQTAFTGLTPNAAVYLSATTAGVVTSTEPAGISQYLGWHQAGGLIHYGWQSEADLLASSTGDTVELIDNTDYSLSYSLCNNFINIYVRLKENTRGAKTLNINLIELGLFAQFCFLRYVQAIESRNTGVTGSGAFNGPVLSFNKLIQEAIPETFGVLGVGASVGTHMILDNSSYYQNKAAGYAYPSYFGESLLPQVKTENMTMQVVYSNNCMAQIGLNFIGQVFPL